MSDPLKPSPALLIAIGSLVVHYEELNSPDGHAFDKTAIDALRNQPEVQAWFEEMNRMAFLPVKRSSGLTPRAADAALPASKNGKGSKKPRR